jgi:uncharacterized protein
MRWYGALLASSVAVALSTLGTVAAHAAPAVCSAEISDTAAVLSAAQIAELTRHAAPLGTSTHLRIRTERSITHGSLNADEKALQESCGWADTANVRQPRLLVIMVATEARQMGIYPGTDLVGTLTDPVWLSIEQQDMRPHFADKDWLGGLEAGIDALQATLPGTAPTPAGATSTRSSRGLNLLGTVFAGAFAVLVVVAWFAGIRRHRRPRYAKNGDYIGPHHASGLGYDRYGVPFGGGFGGNSGGGGGSSSGGGGGSSGF